MSLQLVVIVDHGSTNRKILERLAQSLGEEAAVRSFADPDSALSFCAENPPDLVIAGTAAEQHETASLIAGIRERPSVSDTPVIIVGDREDSAAIERALDAGANDYVLTPIDPADFSLRARTQLKRRSDRRAIAAAGENSGGEGNRPDRQGLRRAHETLLRIIEILPRMICVTDRCWSIGNSRPLSGSGRTG